MKSTYSFTPLALMVAAGLIAISAAPLRASETDDRIEASVARTVAVVRNMAPVATINASE